jgi:hypothetical protein
VKTSTCSIVADIERILEQLGERESLQNLTEPTLQHTESAGVRQPSVAAPLMKPWGVIALSRREERLPAAPANSRVPAEDVLQSLQIGWAGQGSNLRPWD